MRTMDRTTVAVSEDILKRVREPVSAGTRLPLVTVVTPTLNMGHFLEETIQSVLSQDYPHMEYMVIDGGSTDQTLDILKRYRGQLQYYSAPDRGTADAINQGFRRARGAIWTYLNADDTYLPGAVSTAVHRLLEKPDVAGIYGDAYWVNEEGKVLGPYPTREFQPRLLQRECFICQPAAFVRREAIEAVTLLDPRLRYTYDYDLWIRLAKNHSLQKVNAFLATSRLHPSAKTLSARRPAFRETMRLLGDHFGYVPFTWIYSYCCHCIDGRDQFFQALQPSIFKYCLSLPLGTYRNWRSPLKFWSEWARVMTFEGWKRRWRQRRSQVGRSLDSNDLVGRSGAFKPPSSA
jgi:glycosyltransferase involved in cell wall biosynthesis